MQLEIQFFGNSANDILLARIREFVEIIFDEYRQRIERVSLAYSQAEGKHSERVIGSATIETKGGLRVVANDKSGKILQLIQASRNELARSLGATQEEGNATTEWGDSSAAAHCASLAHSRRVHPSRLFWVG